MHVTVVTFLTQEPITPETDLENIIVGIDQGNIDGEYHVRTCVPQESLSPTTLGMMLGTSEAQV